MSNSTGQSRRALLAATAGGLGVAALGAPERAVAQGNPSKEDLVAVAEVERTVLLERWARDMGRWDVMAEQYHPDSVVDISWIKTSGPEFVRLSKASAANGTRSCHVLSPILTDVRGDRATADTGAVIAGQVVLDGVLTALTAYARIVERLERRGDTWRISELRCIYQFDQLSPANPSDELDIDADVLASYRESYSGLSYWVGRTRGPAAVRMDLPGIDQPATINALYAANAAWLSAGRNGGRP
ncbi:nuclear transport factor 2 family protein [Knoellia sp. CPCC 206453]|uniref:nuclear transport factor 2 family protein n=1 Tax=Knoellia pratensis TaxID=3404796 RepID=UPI00362151EF